MREHLSHATTLALSSAKFKACYVNLSAGLFNRKVKFSSYVVWLEFTQMVEMLKFGLKFCF